MNVGNVSSSQLNQWIERKLSASLTKKPIFQLNVVFIWLFSKLKILPINCYLIKCQVSDQNSQFAGCINNKFICKSSHRLEMFKMDVQKCE